MTISLLFVELYKNYNLDRGINFNLNQLSEQVLHC